MIRHVCPKKSHVFTKSKDILNNTSKTYNLNILRSYNANWTHFWHFHPWISIFCPDCLFLSFLSSSFDQTHCIPCTVYRKKEPTSLFLLFGAFFLLLLLLLVCWHLLLFLSNWLSPPFQRGLKHKVKIFTNQILIEKGDQNVVISFEQARSYICVFLACSSCSRRRASFLSRLRKIIALNSW